MSSSSSSRSGSSAGSNLRRRLEVVGGQEAHQVADVLEAALLVLGGEVGDARLRVVAHRPAQLLELDLLAGDRFDHFGAGDEHVRGLFDHEDEVGHRRRVDGAAGAGAHDQADLGNDARAFDVADEDVAVGAERDDPLLDPGAAGVVDPDHRRPDLGGEVHHLAHLLRHHLAEAAAEDREVLGEDEHRPPFDRPVAGDDRVAPGPFLLHVEVEGPVADEGVELLEGAGVEQLLDPLAGGHLALRVLLLHRLLGGRVDRFLAQLAQMGELLVVGFRVLSAHRSEESISGAAMGPSRQREGPAEAGPPNLPNCVCCRLEFGADRVNLEFPVDRIRRRRSAGPGRTSRVRFAAAVEDWARSGSSRLWSSGSPIRIRAPPPIACLPVGQAAVASRLVRLPLSFADLAVT